MQLYLKFGGVHDVCPEVLIILIGDPLASQNVCCLHGNHSAPIPHFHNHRM